MILTFAEQVRVMLQRKNKSIEDLANDLQTTRQNLWNQLNRDNFKYKDMKRISAALGCDLLLEIVEREDPGE